MGMFFFNITAGPKPGDERTADAGGAYVNCWVNFQIEDGAELLARFYIEEAGWLPAETEEARWVEEEDYEDEPELLQYFREAEQDGASFVFYSWPVGGEEDEDEEDLHEGGHIN
jgi:hypothetical protein